MARMQTGQYPNAITAGIRKVAYSTMSRIPQEARQLFNFIDRAQPGTGTGRKFFDDLRVGSLGTAAAKAEGTALTYATPTEDALVRYEWYVYGLATRYTLEMKQSDLYGLVPKLGREIGAAMSHQLEVQAHRPINGGTGTGAWSTGYTAKGFDTLALFSTAHTLLPSANTDANKASTDLDLGPTALENALIDFEETLSDENLPDPRKASVLVVGPKLRYMAKQLLQSELQPFTGNNEVNEFGGEGLRFFVDHFLTDTAGDSWFLLGPKSDVDINVWVPIPPSIETGDDFDTGDTKIKGIFAVASGHGDWRSTYGSYGA